MTWHFSGLVLQTAVNVAERPITQQGLAGVARGGSAAPGTAMASGTATASGRGPGRRYEDKSFYIGELRKKMAELNTEVERTTIFDSNSIFTILSLLSQITRLSREIESANEEQSTYLAYDKRVKELAAELTGERVTD